MKQSKSVKPPHPTIRSLPQTTSDLSAPYKWTLYKKPLHTPQHTVTLSYFFSSLDTALPYIFVFIFIYYIASFLLLYILLTLLTFYDCLVILFLIWCKIAQRQFRCNYLWCNDNKGYSILFFYSNST